MKDLEGREIDYLRISITDRCNLRCRYCMPPRGVPYVPHEEILRYDEILEITKVCAELGIANIKITGGEPLVRKNAAELIAEIKRIPGIKKVTLTTNGVLLGKNLSQLTSAGLDGVNISLDTIDRKKYAELTGQDCLPEVLASIDKAASEKTLKVKLNTVLIEGVNEEEAPELAQLALDRPIDVRFIEMMPLGRGAGYSGIGSEEVLEKLTHRFGTPQPVREKLGSGPARYVHFDNFCGNIGFISPMSHKFCGDCNRVRLTARGILKPCLQYVAGLDLKEILRGGGTGQGKQDEAAEADEVTLRDKIAACIADKPKEHCFGMEAMQKAIQNDMRDKSKENMGENSLLERQFMSGIGG